MPRSLVKLLLKYFFVLISPVLILAILGYVSIFIARRHATEQMDRLAETSLLQIERVSDQLLEEVEATAVALGTAGQVLRVLEARMDAPAIDLGGLRELDLVRNLVNTSAHARPSIESIYIYLEGFESVLTTDSEIMPLGEMQDRSWLPEYMTQSQEVLTWAARRTYTPLGETGPKEAVISVYQRLFNFTAGDLSGVVVLNLRERAVRRLLREAAVSEGQHFVVFDNGEDLIVSDLDNAELFVELRRAVHAREDTLHIGGIEYLISSQRSEQTDWLYLTLTPRDAYFAPVTAMVRINISIVTLAVLLGLSLAGIMARRSYRYITEVVDVIERSRAGHELPTMQGHSTTGLSYITYHVLRAFVERQYYQLQLSERIYRQKTLELLALQSQMNPHFLFNTLEALNWQILSETGKPGAANEMVGSLAQIMKYALRTPTTFVTLREELENVDHYVRLQSLRRQRAYDLAVDVPPELRSATMVPMTLQPLVENAIIHGFKRRQGGRVEIAGTLHGQTLLLTVSDDGIGVPQQRLEELREELAKPLEPGWEHVGLVNTIRRLRLAFDADIRVEIGPSTSGGFKVALKLPMRVAEAAGVEV